MRGHGDVSQLAVEDIPAPTIQHGGDVLVRLRAGALNHLDLWTLRGLPGLSVEFPHILGGDGAGEVEAVGADVTAAAPGDRVMLDPGLSCHECEMCLAGEHSLCSEYRLLGEHVPGALAEYIVVPQENVVRIPGLPEGHEPEKPSVCTRELQVVLILSTLFHNRTRQHGMSPGVYSQKSSI